MDNSPHTRFQVTDRSYLALTKKGISQLAGQVGFRPQRLGEIDLIVAEIASNLVKHGGGGSILVRHFATSDNAGLEIISIDSGPGIADPARMMQDGISTTGTLGSGLGAIKRLADHFQLYSLKGWGTILLARILKNPVPSTSSPGNFESRSLLVPKPGEIVCGDGCHVKRTSDYTKLFLGDGLGHGPEANWAVQEAIKAFRLCPFHSPVDIIRHIHQAIKKTRGIVGSVVVFDTKSQQWTWCGVGNITTRVVGPVAAKNVLSYNGIIGLNLPNTMNNHVLPFERGQLLIMCSDGLQSRWDHAKYPQIHRYDLTILAAALYKDYARQTDDTSLFIGRI
ncbi:serine/threonine protein kinase [Larkinella harenae]